MPTEPHRGKIPLVHFAVEPHDAQVGNAIHRLPGHEALSGKHGLLDDHAVHRGSERHRFADLARFLDLTDLVRRDLPVQESAPGGLEQIIGALDGLRGAGGQIAIEPSGEEQLLLGGNHHRRIQVEQRLSHTDRLPGEIDMQLVDPAIHAGGDRLEHGLVVCHDAHRPHDAVQRSEDDRGVGDADPSGCFRGEHHGTRTIGGWGRGVIVGGRFGGGR